jgi:tetratricopeptide (TPR) repeat protein
MDAPNEATDHDSLLDAVVSDYLREADAGREPNRRDWLARYPDLAADLNEFFVDRDRVLGWTEPLRDAVQRGLRSDTPLPSDGPTLVYGSAPGLTHVTRHFGDYELLTCLGQGGMGIVFRARQISLDRLVALKMVRGDYVETDTEARRFRREAELVAQLDHPHIVPVYEVGEQDGRCFFSMKLIEGGDLLKQRERFAAPAEAAALTRTVALAVHHAHQRGILHRDLKPSNILLDEAGRPYVTDFGLAKRLAADSHLTQTGLLVGTPSYMAPEQAGGSASAVTTATDVYGLGTILYVLLTGHAPFAGETVLETLEQVRAREPRPPRRLNRSIPRDLETICLKCLAKDPAQRYASAAHLAEDLSRFVEGKPISARPAGAVTRLAKWARRRPALAALIGVSAVAAASLLVVSMTYQHQLHGALDEAQNNAEEARQSKEQATERYRQARAAMHKMLERVSDRSRADVPRVQELRRQQQEDALAFLLSVAEQQSDDPEILADVGEARYQAAKLQLELGRRQAALANFEQARDLFEALANRFPGEPSYRFRWADTLRMHCGCDITPEASASYLRRALSLFEELSAQDGDNATYQAGCAACHHNLGGIAFNRRDWKEAEDQFRQALAIEKELTRLHPRARQYLGSLAKTQLALSVAFQQQAGREQECTDFHNQAEGSLEQLIREDPNDYESMEALAALRVNWAYVLQAQNKADAALADLDKNLALLRPVHAREPTLDPIRDKLLRTYGVRAQILENLKRYPECIAAQEQVVALAEPAARINYRVQLASLRCDAGDYVHGVADVQAIAAELADKASCTHLYWLARICESALAGLADDKMLSDPERSIRAGHYETLAVQLLEKARKTAKEDEWTTQCAPKLAEDFPHLKNNDAFLQLVRRHGAAAKP